MSPGFGSFTPTRALLRAQRWEYTRDPLGARLEAIVLGGLLGVFLLIDLVLVPRGSKGILGGGLPTISAVGFLLAGIGTLGPALARYREAGILRQLGTAPVPARSFLLAHTALRASVGLALLLAFLVLIAVLAGPPPRTLLAIAVVLGAGLANALAIGQLVAVLLRSTAYAPTALFVIPACALVDEIGRTLAASFPGAIARFLELAPFALYRSALDALLTGSAAPYPTWGAVVILFGCAALIGALGLRLFRWPLTD